MLFDLSRMSAAPTGEPSVTEQVLAQVKFLDESVNTALERAQQIVDKKFQTPLTPLNYRRDLLNIQREVQRLYRELVRHEFSSLP